jgi:hypothetical protein
MDLFNYIEIVLKRLKIYPEVSVTPAMFEILVKIMIELISVLAIATKDVNEGLLSEFILPTKSLSEIALLREICEATNRRK